MTIISSLLISRPVDTSKKLHVATSIMQIAFAAMSLAFSTPRVTVTS